MVIECDGDRVSMISADEDEEEDEEAEEAEEDDNESKLRGRHHRNRVRFFREATMLHRDPINS
eukprot:scaffold3438_cov243-Pinguiococcus_pyrenoidosus.AAC.3